MCGPAGISIESILGRLEILGGSTPPGWSRAGRFNDESWAKLRAIGIFSPIRFAGPRCKGAREDCEALIASLALGDGPLVDPSCTLTLEGLNHYVQVRSTRRHRRRATLWAHDLITSRAYGSATVPG